MDSKKRKYGLIDMFIICIKNNPIECIIILILTVIGALLPSLLISLNSDFIDRVLVYAKKKTDFNQVLINIIKIISTLAYMYFYTIIVQLINERVNIGLKNKFNSLVIERSIRLKYEYIENSESCDLINRVLNYPGLITVQNIFLHMFSCISLITYFLGLIIIVWRISWWYIPLLLISAIPLFITSYFMSKDVYNNVRWNSELARKSNYIEFDILRGRDLAAERTLFGYTRYFNNKFESYFIRAVNLEAKILKKWLIVNKILTVIIVSVCIFITFITLGSLKENSITLGVFIAIITAIFQLESVLTTQIPDLVSVLSEDSEYTKDFTKFMALEEEDTIQEKRNTKESIQTIEFKDVYFKYPGTEQMILNGVSFKIEKGKHYAIVGRNGSGKSTLTKLLLGLYKVDRGEILINGKNMNDYTNGEIYSLYSIVYQDYVQYSISTKDNIGIGNMEQRNDLKKINEVAELAGIKDVIDQLPEGMNTPLGKVLDDGVDLSGGQWQRVALARSLMKERTVRILDEPTSALDPLEESRLYKKYAEISKDNTTIFISHRLGSTKLADKIFVLDQGKLIEIGNHNELMQKRGLYREMFNTQKEWYDEN